MAVVNDYSSWDVYDGASEGSGRSEKIWLISSDGDIGLFKFPKIDPSTNQETTEHISEHLAHQIGDVLDVPTARVELGVYDGRIGSMSYLVSRPNEALIEGINFISGIYPGYDSNEMIDTSTGHYYCIDHILTSTKRFVPESIWLEMMLFDFLIGNADRHQSNWAILASFTNTSEEAIRIRKCPLYDNGSSLCCYVNNDQVNNMFGKDPGPFNALVDSRSRSIIRIDGTKKTKPPHKMVVQHLLTHFPETAKIAKRFIDRLDENKIDMLLDMYQPDVLNEQKNKLIRRYLRRKIEILSTLLEGGN